MDSLDLIDPGPSRVARLASETDFAGWRAVARALRAQDVPPERVLWTVDGAAGLAGRGVSETSGFTVPKAFLKLADTVVLHRSDERFDLLYRLVWKLADQPDLLQAAADPDVARVRAFAAAVGGAAQRMKAFIDFRPFAEASVAWFEPAHRVAERTAPFFVPRLGRPFSILTPDTCVHWDGATFSTTPGADPADAPASGLEDYWRSRFGVLFARNLDQSPSIPPHVMAAQPSARVLRAAQRASRDDPYDGRPPTTAEELRAGVQLCRRCDLWRGASQGVTGEGPVRARLMFVGEQPGDQEDLAGRPFVGPAGQMLDRALREAGVPRAQTYVTNAVKHFKHELRGKRRIHKSPNAGEVEACRWWLDAERRIVRPRVIVALGATAASAVFGKAMPVARSRQQAFQLPDQGQGVVTYHPSYLLRLPDEQANAEAYAGFVTDLKFAWRMVG